MFSSFFSLLSKAHLLKLKHRHSESEQAKKKYPSFDDADSITEKRDKRIDENEGKV